MTTTLITGKGGTPHVTSGDMGAMQAGVIGNGSYLLQGSDGTFPTVTMQDANHALIPVLNLVVEGRYARVTEAETATIESGMSGQNRNDLVCLKYTRNNQNIETAAIAVLKGTPNTGTAADPTVPSGSIHSASGTAWIPIARIPIRGITPDTPVMLIKQLPPMSKLWDSVTPVTGQVRMPYSDRYITLVRVGRIVTACAYITLTSDFTQVSNMSVNETIPEGFRPSGDSRAIMRGTDNSGAISFYLYGTAAGKMVLNGTGYTSRFVGISGCWITA